MTAKDENSIGSGRRETQASITLDATKMIYGGCKVLSRDLTEKPSTSQQKIKLGEVFMKKHQETHTVLIHRRHFMTQELKSRGRHKKSESPVHSVFPTTLTPSIRS